MKPSSLYLFNCPTNHSHQLLFSIFFFFNDTATTEIYTLSLHDALPISGRGCPVPRSHPRPPRSSRPAGRPPASFSWAPPPARPHSEGAAGRQEPRTADATSQAFPD